MRAFPATPANRETKMIVFFCVYPEENHIFAPNAFDKVLGTEVPVYSHLSERGAFGRILSVEQEDDGSQAIVSVDIPETVMAYPKMN